MKKGFTLAEVLIALAILGVVAAMTVPALMVNVQKQQAGPALMKELNILTQVNRMILADNDSKDLYAACEIQKNENGTSRAKKLAQCMAPYLNGKVYTREEAFDFKNNYYGYKKNYSHIATYSEGGISTADGFLMLFGGGTGYSSGNNYASYMNLAIDINGMEKGPNEEAKDLFYIFISKNGDIFAMGSQAFANDLSRQTDHEWKDYGSWKYGCTSEKVTNAQTCTGSIVDNGGKVIYPW